ncbi:MAG: hypothetical protein FD180_2700 [Planctomycetota bacterium]|nr:MAG: hypothetical protein FD180_2700 [Planctomycetota bacterium]
MILHLLANTDPAAPPTFWEGDAMSVLGVWASVGFTLALYTFLYKDNAVFKFAEHVYVGVTNGWLLWQAWFASVKPDLVYPLGRLIGHDVLRRPQALEEGDTWWLLVPAVFATFMLLRFIPKASWLSRWSFAFIVGTTAGTQLPLQVQAFLFRQMGAMLDSPIKHGEDGGFLFMGTLSAILLFIGVISVLAYFVFAVEHKGAVRPVARTGVVFLMIAFGAHFGYTVMGRESLLIERVQFLIGSSMAKGAENEPNPHHATVWLLIAVVAAVVVLEVLRVKREASAKVEAEAAKGPQA